MPYVITTTQPTALSATPLMGRRAVATLEEARAHVYGCGPHTSAERNALPESGGTIGPLPDGTVIEVEQQPDDFDVAAYNARYAAEAGAL